MRPTKLRDPNSESGIMALSPSRCSSSRNSSGVGKDRSEDNEDGRRQGRGRILRSTPRSPNPTRLWRARPPGRSRRHRVVDVPVDVAEDAKAMAAMATGMLIRKARRQLPRIDKPSAEDRSDRARSGAGRRPYARWRRPFASPEKLWPRIARLLGISMAALAPCTKRASSNKPRVGATAQARDAIPNSRTPAIRRRRRP